MRNIFLILLVAYLTIFPAHAIEGLRFENITINNGLSHNTVRDVMQDSHGFMWISTVNGLNRYDGYKFIFSHPGFSLPSLTENNIRYTKEDPNGRIWVHTTSRYVNCYDMHTESFVDYTGKNDERSYKYIEFFSNGDVWLWGLENGACHVHDKEGEAVPVLYDINNIGTNIVNFVWEDTNSRIWLGTDKGLIQLTDGVPRFCNLPPYIYHSCVETGELIYFFTENNKIVLFDKERSIFLPDIPIKQEIDIIHTAVLNDKQILLTAHEATYILDLTSSEVLNARDFFGGEQLRKTNILTDNKGNHWVYNKSGNLWRYNPLTRKFDKLPLIPSSVLSLIDLERYSVFCDSRGIVWITTYGNGLFILEESGRTTHLTTTNSELRTNYLLSVSEDESGTIWIGTENTGISRISLTNYNKRAFLPDPDKTEPADKIIRSIYEEESTGDIWIGTKSGDVYQLDKELENKKVFPLQKGAAYCIATDTIGNKWIGTKGDGLVIIPKEQHNLTGSGRYLFPDDNTGGSNIYAILRDRKGRMWIGTFGHGLYLGEYDHTGIRMKPFPAISNKQKQVRYLIQDRSGLIWAGGENGIVIFDPEELLEDHSAFKWLHFDKTNPNSLNNNIVKTIFEDSRGEIWVGTSGGGLNLALRNDTQKSVEFKHYTSEEGLINDMVQAILEDNGGNLWISTESGLSRFNVTDNFFDNYNFTDSWESDLFCEAAAFKRQNGELLFGSYNGMHIIDPAQFESRKASSRITITNLTVNGIQAKPNAPDSPLKESITETKTIKLASGQNSFSLEFSFLNFLSSYSNRYTYILENYEKEWNPVTQYNVATYKNIPPGKYRFKVKSGNDSGKADNIETCLEIIVVPPFWKSPQALLLYFILFVMIAFFTMRLVLTMNKLHNKVEVEKQLTELRLRFFTNISHEFRTPLTIIKGNIESMNATKALPPNLKKYIRNVDKSSSRLMRLIDQLLEFRKMQNGKPDLRLEYTDAATFLKGIFEMFSETAERKGIQYHFFSDEGTGVLLLDKGKIEQITYNLLSNAFKHTPENGHITLQAVYNREQEQFTLTVSDSGIGIPADKQDLLFVRFKQINYTASGIGIGLHLTSELTNVHKGKIEYTTSEWGGACFTVTIPTSPDSYNPEDIVNFQSISIETSMAEEEVSTEIVRENNIHTLKYKILLIEDDEEVLLFLEDQLQEHFTIITARNGLAGWERATSEEPSLIVCDVMMPEMDGFEVTRKLKSDFNTSHIPIILLTAHSSAEHQLEGINAGADSYITKPFSTRYLISRIIKLIEQREKLQYKFAHEPAMVQTTICTSSKDHDFITRIHQIIEEHLDNPDFTVDEFAQAANMGRSIFYKKVKGLTNYSPNEYLRIIRLKKAAELLKATDYNISEIAYKVGFNDPFYFSKCFKEQFGMRPTQFRDSGKG